MQRICTCIDGLPFNIFAVTIGILHRIVHDRIVHAGNADGIPVRRAVVYCGRGARHYHLQRALPDGITAAHKSDRIISCTRAACHAFNGIYPHRKRRAERLFNAFGVFDDQRKHIGVFCIAGRLILHEVTRDHAVTRAVRHLNTGHRKVCRVEHRTVVCVGNGTDFYPDGATGNGEVACDGRLHAVVGQQAVQFSRIGERDGTAIRAGVHARCILFAVYLHAVFGGVLRKQLCLVAAIIPYQTADGIAVCALCDLLAVYDGNTIRRQSEFGGVDGDLHAARLCRMVGRGDVVVDGAAVRYVAHAADLAAACDGAVRIERRRGKLPGNCLIVDGSSRFDNAAVDRIAAARLQRMFHAVICARNSCIDLNFQRRRFDGQFA